MGWCMLPNQSIDVSKNEIARLYKLSANITGNQSNTQEIDHISFQLYRGVKIRRIRGWFYFFNLI
jgi:hypothetical protein